LPGAASGPILRASACSLRHRFMKAIFKTRGNYWYSTECLRPYGHSMHCSWPLLSIFTAKGISPSLSLRTKGSAESRHWRDVPRSTLSSQVQSWPENLHRIPVQTEDDSGCAVHPLPVYRSFLHFLPLYPSHTPLM